MRNTAPSTARSVVEAGPVGEHEPAALKVDGDREGLLVIAVEEAQRVSASTLRSKED